MTETRLKPAEPESESVTVTEALTGTNLLFGGQRVLGLALHATVGGVLSMLIPLTVAEAEFPARSVHVPVTDWFAASVERIVGAGGLPAARPERLSAHWKLTVTFVLFQPLAFGAGVRAGVTVGGVLSMLIALTVAEAEFPATSVQVPITD